MHQEIWVLLSVMIGIIGVVVMHSLWMMHPIEIIFILVTAPQVIVSGGSYRCGLLSLNASLIILGGPAPLPLDHRESNAI